MLTPKGVLKLIERFERNRDAYRSHAYNETQARREFIDPLFKAFGWDVNNEKGYAETDHEKSLIQRQIDATDKQIDQLVYELYSFTKEEIKIVGGATR